MLTCCSVQRASILAYMRQITQRHHWFPSFTDRADASVSLNSRVPKTCAVSIIRSRDCDRLTWLVRLEIPVRCLSVMWLTDVPIGLYRLISVWLFFFCCCSWGGCRKCCRRSRSRCTRRRRRINTHSLIWSSFPSTGTFTVTSEKYRGITRASVPSEQIQVGFTSH